jgi:hypothetical protein
MLRIGQQRVIHGERVIMQEGETVEFSFLYSGDPEPIRVVLGAYADWPPEVEWPHGDKPGVKWQLLEEAIRITFVTKTSIPVINHGGIGNFKNGAFLSFKSTVLVNNKHADIYIQFSVIGGKEDG